jgi:signal transduction histidine kinase
MNTQTKTALLFMLPLVAILTLFSGVVYYAVKNYSQNDFFGLLEIRAITAAKAELDDDTTIKQNELKELREKFFAKLPQERDYFFAVENNPSFQDESDSLQLPASFFKEIVSKQKANHQKQHIFYKGILYKSSKGPYIVIVSAENYYEVHHAAFLKRTLFISILAALIVSGLISWYFSNYVFRPLRHITQQVEQISSENLHLRLDENNRNQELKALAHTFNHMLDRIETSFETQNNFISNASHELRTPLTAIIGEADVILSKVRKPEEYMESIRVILDEAEKLDSKTKALLFLAQTGFNGKVQKFEKVRMDQLLMDVKETIEKINPKSKIVLDMSLLPENPMLIKVNGNEQLLHLAFSNIISNACKYSDCKPVKVSLGASDSRVIIVVTDQGIGIPENELKYIYDPFFRASNTKNYEGYGIGLPLSRNIIRMHHGELKVNSLKDTGTIVQVNLPVFVPTS